jgi:Flp pilus assembly protein TadB
MAQLVLLVVAAAWAAVLIPPMLRSRVENRPNSSVTDFRRQLNTLQSTSSPTRRTIGRPLVQSPLQRPASPGRPHHRRASVHSAATATQTRPARHVEGHVSHHRSHGDPSGAHHRQTHMDRQAARRRTDPRSDVRRRRTNVLFLLIVSTACTLFLAATTSSTAMLYLFALSFLALCGYVYLLAQLRQRQASGWSDDWMKRY